MLTVIYLATVKSQLKDKSDVRASVGFGVQYAGLDWQGAKRKGDDGFRIGYGIAGEAGGLDHYISNNLTVGLQRYTSLLFTTLGVDMFTASSPLGSRTRTAAFV